MAEALASSAAEDGPHTQWKFSGRRSRKSGCSNIFSGVNLNQLHQLFRTAGDRNAEHRAKRVWRGMDAHLEGAAEEEGEEGQEVEVEAGLAQALVGLRVRARNKVGLRAEGHREHRWPKAAGYLRIEERSCDPSPVEEEADLVPSPGQLLLPTEEEISENPNPFKPSSWRVGVARQESDRDSDRYLHRLLH
ncbi:uncharacterized protein avpi1 [Embiotoca jacksoni]|uniref:uncharacterized protein avpi1 n=1 Tax=Embiotoca jacksoni TaxID=100190 RepID=UPI003703F72D